MDLSDWTRIAVAGRLGKTDWAESICNDELCWLAKKLAVGCARRGRSLWPIDVATAALRLITRDTWMVLNP